MSHYDRAESFELQGEALSGIALDGADMREASFVRANLRGACFRFADLTDADLAEAVLRGASFKGADLRGAVFDGANLTDASFYNADVSRAVEGHMLCDLEDAREDVARLEARVAELTKALATAHAALEQAGR